MDAINHIIAEYSRLRGEGLAVKAVLNALHTNINSLDEASKQELVRQLRAWESDHPQPAETNPVTPAEDVPHTPFPAGDSLDWVTCPNCGKSNQRREVLCYACGRLLERSYSENETHTLAETNDLSYSDDFFGPDSLLVLQVRGNDNRFHAYPQKAEQELIIGRQVSGSPVFPDIDLSKNGGEEYGVSRLHLSVRYQPRYKTLCIFDLGSANGTYINGQRLHPHEVRVLRHGDEIRLGRLVLVATFLHDQDNAQA